MAALLLGNEDFDDDNPPLTLHRQQLPQASRIRPLLLPKTSGEISSQALLRTQTPHCPRVLGSSLSKKMILHPKPNSWSSVVLTDAFLEVVQLSPASRICSLLLPKTYVETPSQALLRTQTPNCPSVLGSSLNKKMVLHPESYSWSILMFTDALLEAAIAAAPFLSAATGDALDFN